MNKEIFQILIRFSCQKFNIDQMKRMNAESLERQLVIKLAQCILISRVILQKDQHLKSKFLQREIEEFRSQNSLSDFPKLLNPVLHSIQQQICSKSKSFPPPYQLYIHIYIQSCEEKEDICVEQWSIRVEETGGEDEEEEWEKIVAIVLEEILFFAYRILPGSCFEKNRESIMRKFTYKLQIREKQNSYKKSISGYPNFRKYHCLTRVCSKVEIQVECFSHAHLEELKKLLFNAANQQKKILRTPKKQHRYSIGDVSQCNEEEFIELQPENQRKHSMYEQYDSQFDCTFLSNSEKSFQESPRTEVKEIQVILGEEERYQLLEVSGDEKLLQQNYELFEKLNQNLREYLQL